VQPEQYKTLQQRAVTEIIVRKSRFISSVAPVTNSDEAVAFVNVIKSQHREATHNVSAWVIDDRLMRCSDDGEPSGTAGRPVLEVIQRSGLVQTAVVVTRYFGGILLGAGGLVRAYSQSAHEGVAAAGIKTVQLYRVIEVEVEYPLSAQVKYYLEQQVVNLAAEYGEKVIFNACCTPQNLEIIANAINEITGGKSKLHHREDCYL